MKAICIIGMTGTGKTTEAKKLLDMFNNLDHYIYDVNAEYKEFTNKPLPTIDGFMSEVLEVRNSLILFEEATIFFSNRGYSGKVVDMLVRKRHTNNLIVFCFHSLRTVPTYIFEMIDYFYIKRTNDTLKQIKTRFKSENLLNVFEKVKNNSKFEPYYTEKVRGSEL